MIFSWELASALKESKNVFDSAGVKLIAVGVGAPNKARMLAERVSSLLLLFLFKNISSKYFLDIYCLFSTLIRISRHLLFLPP